MSTNLNNTVPAALSGYTNVSFQTDGSGNVSACVPTLYPSTGSIVIAQVARPASLDLTTEGTIDWLYVNGNYNSPIDTVLNPTRKALGGCAIGWFGFKGSGGAYAPGAYADPSTTFSYDAGDSCASAAAGSGLNNGIYIASLNQGFRLRVPADTFQRVLRLYYGATSTTLHTVCRLSDGSFADTVNDIAEGTTGNATLGVITYNSGRDGQYMDVAFYSTVTDGGNILVVAATLANS